MQCPLCIDAALEPRFHGTVEVDVCPTCKGVWLDRGELQKLVDLADAPRPPSGSERTRDHHGHDDNRDRHDRNDKRDRSRDRDDEKRDKKRKKRKSFGERLGDVLDDVLDFDFD